MITKESIPNVLGLTAYGSGHDKLGKIGHVYVDDRTEQPEWMTVRTGMFGKRETFVPAQPAQLRGDEVVVPYEKDQVSNAPIVETDAAGHISEQDEARLYAHYGMAHPGPAAPQGVASSDDGMTRSGQQRRKAPVRLERERLEREPGTEEPEFSTEGLADDER